MNMLENKIPLGLLSKEDQKLFEDCPIALLETYDGEVVGWENVKIGNRTAKTYRLKLVKAAYYKIYYDGCNGVFRFECFGIGKKIVMAGIYLSHSGKIHTKYEVCKLADIDKIRPATEAEKEELNIAFQKTIYPKNPLDSFPPIFICPCKSLAALDIRCTRELIEGPSEDGYRNYEPGDINGTIVCTKCKTKMTYNIESLKGG